VVNTVSFVDALMRITNYSAEIEKYDPAKKRPFFSLCEFSAHRPEVLRYSNLLNRGKANFVFLYDSSWDGHPLLEEIGKIST
jgi:hypothetical protein